MKAKNNTLKPLILSLIVMAFWGSLYPTVKMGMKAFNVGSSVPQILMFAGSRFLFCGVIICLIALFKRDKIEGNKTKSIISILIIGLFSIILNYAFVYIGISSTDSSKTALIKQLGPLFYVCFAFLFFESEKFSILKIVGAFVGFLGIFAINFDQSGITFYLADVFILLSSLSSMVANILTKKMIGNQSTFWVTGISQLFGGLVLIIVSLIMGGSLLEFNLSNVGIYLYIALASTVAYVLWNYVLKISNLSNMFIIKFAESLFACIFGAILLKENIFKWQYLIAFVLIFIGIFLGNKKPKDKLLKK